MPPYAKPVHDNRGTEIRVGHKVAYNWSGQVAVGRVLAIDRVARYGGYGPLIRIAPEFPKAAQRQAESKVRDNHNVLVLFEDGQGPDQEPEESALESLLLPGLKD